MNTRLMEDALYPALLPNEAIPSYLDLGKYQINGSIPYTHSSNGLFALQAALQQLQPER